MKQLSLLLIVLIWSCQTKTPEPKDARITDLPYFNEQDFTPNWSQGTHKIPPFEFINQNGVTINEDKYKGSVYIANFFFTSCPSICPKLTNSMQAIQETYKSNDKIKLLSHTMMPWVDSVEVLKDYADKNNVNDEQWDLVTGAKADLYEIARAGYFVDQDYNPSTDSSDFIHTENFVLVDENGHIRGIYNGTLDVDVARLIRHTDLLLKSNTKKSE